MRNAISMLQRKFLGLPSKLQTFLLICGLCAAVLILSWFRAPRIASEMPPGSSVHVPNAATDNEPFNPALRSQWENIKAMPKAVNPLPLPPASSLDGNAIGGEQGAPLIAHAAELAVSTKEFARSRSSLEDLLERHHGYAARLRMVGQPSGSTLTATLRVPSSEFSGAVEDLKSLGNVVREEQTADEVTLRRADLEARLTNAQRSLAHLQQLMTQNTIVTNQAEVQKQLSNVNAEIARLEAKRTAAERQVTFAQILFSMREEIVVPTQSFGAQFRAAALAGLSDAFSSLSGILLFVFGRGPVIALWVVLLFFPTRWLWRKWHANSARAEGLASGI